MIDNKKGLMILGALGALGVLLYLKKDAVIEATSDGMGAVVDMFTPRGIRNNNPGNIRHGSQWQGMAAQQPDSAFIRFTSPEYGIRAISKILDTYASKYNLRTVRGIISRWAPPNENDTESYVQTVASKLGVSPDQNIDLNIAKPALIEAIIKHENGQQPYAMATITTGAGMA